MNKPHFSAAARGLRRLTVRALPGAGHRAVLRAGALALPCVLGPAGITRRKREGDGATPAGRFAITSGFFRPDRASRPRCALPLRATGPLDGWCDDPGSPRYNQPVPLPCAASCEAMWRADRLYDCGLVIDYNQSRPRKGRGSAIFLHVMAPAATPTAGCVALRPGDLGRLLPRLARGCRIVIG